MTTHVLLNLALMLTAPAGEPFIEGFVPSETGFDGAVTVVSGKVDGDFGVVLVKVPYRDLYGKTRTGLARLVVHRRDVEAGRPIPPFCHVHYEMGVGGAKNWAKRGWVVTTAAYDAEHPIDAAIANGNNQARAIIQWVRRLRFVDRTHLHINGGSQGGYMALAMSAVFFPVAATTANAPVVNWAYNLNYFEQNKAVSGYPDKLKDSPLPVMASVTMLADWCYKYFGTDLSTDAWYYVSPVAYLDLITNPTMVTAATGDMLVPMEQMTREGLHPCDAARFPKGYQRSFDKLTINERSRRTFEELVPKHKRFTHRAPKQENTYELTIERFRDPKSRPEKQPEKLDRPWSREHQWSLFYMDEGPPSPYAPHTTYFWVTAPDSFVKHYREATPSPEILNAIKLENLIQRYALRLTKVPLLKDGKPTNRLNFAALERRDVLQGLLDYAAISAAHSARLTKVYAACETKSFGPELTLKKLRDELARLKQGQTTKPAADAGQAGQ